MTGLNNGIFVHSESEAYSLNEIYTVCDKDKQIPWNVSSGTIGDIENLQAGKKAEKQTGDPHENGFFKAYREVWIIGLPGQGGVLQSDCQEVDMIQVRCKGGNRAYPKFGTTELIH
ncbi:hypothetical protein HUJ05_008019 [Dendroctonus ponderosae]|nr:hypothetical protein HUJ05_008019 [Dendroctonus ponderosae]